MSEPDPLAGVERPYPDTPDGRYFVVRGRLWRKSNPMLPEAERKRLTAELMAARRAVGVARKQADAAGLAAAHAAVDDAKIAPGERGSVWWDDGAPDLKRRMARNTPYAAWLRALASHAKGMNEQRGLQRVRRYRKPEI